MTKPNEPTLTCSEVVERLRANIFNQQACEKILTEWRERRVQELEELLREIGTHSGDEVCDACMVLITKHSGVTYSTDSAARITSDPAATEIRVCPNGFPNHWCCEGRCTVCGDRVSDEALS